MHTTAQDVNTDLKKDIPFGVTAQETIFDNTYKDRDATQAFTFINGYNAMNTSKLQFDNACVINISFSLVLLFIHIRIKYRT